MVAMPFNFSVASFLLFFFSMSLPSPPFTYIYLRLLLLHQARHELERFLGVGCHFIFRDVGVDLEDLAFGVNQHGRTQDVAALER